MAASLVYDLDGRPVVHDAFGRKVEVGDKITYSVSGYGSQVGLRRGVVKDILEKVTYGDAAPQLVIDPSWALSPGLLNQNSWLKQVRATRIMTNTVVLLPDDAW